MTSKTISIPDLAGFTERNGTWYAEEIPLADLAKIRQDTKAYAPALRQFSQQLLTQWLSHF